VEQHALTLDMFNFGPPLNVPNELFEPFPHPRYVKDLKILTVRESMHELMPKGPGQHGMLYMHRNDVPKYLVILETY
jgi:hypothetical protein